MATKKKANGKRAAKAKVKAPIAVLVTTEFRGVFFGYTEDPKADPIVLKNARNCIYWPAQTGGFLGLTTRGPVDGSRIGDRAAEITLTKLTCVSTVDEVAQKAWEAAPVYRG